MNSEEIIEKTNIIEHNKEVIALSAYTKIIKYRNIYADNKFNYFLSTQDRIKFLKSLIVFFQQYEEYEKCAKLMKVLNSFGIVQFNTNRI